MLRRDEQNLPGVAEAAAAGDPDAAETLARQIGGSLLGTVRKVLGPSHPNLEEVAQDAALAVIRALPHFCGESSISQFACRVALLTALREHRRVPPTTRAPKRLEAGGDNLSASTAETAYLEPVSQQRRELTRHLLTELSEPTAEALALHYLMGLTVEEIAEFQWLSPNAVWNHLREGKQALRRTLENTRR